MAVKALKTSTFAWEGTNKQGAKIKGEASGQNPALVKAQLRKQGWGDVDAMKRANIEDFIACGLEGPEARRLLMCVRSITDPRRMLAETGHASRPSMAVNVEQGTLARSRYARVRTCAPRNMRTQGRGRAGPSRAAAAAASSDIAADMRRSGSSEEHAPGAARVRGPQVRHWLWRDSDESAEQARASWSERAA